jgi:hypothetical protein
MFKHVERLVGQRRREFEHQRRERRIPTQRLELGQMLDGTLGALTGQFEPIVLVNPRGSLGLNAKGANQGQALDQFREVPGRRRIGGLPQPRQGALSAADANLELL